uniref:Uncharacterized protein n=1 Tax=Rhizophora mucronata TaxID=61149 RepID=A0A2P2P9A4_RHIMU
MGTFPFLF